MTKKSKEEKKKERERESRKKVLRRRAAIRAAAKKEREESLKDREYQKIVNRVDGRTIVNKSPEEQHELLQHNLEILKALRDQQDYLERENVEKKVQLATLEKESIFEEGHQGFAPTPPSKKGFKASADVVFTPTSVDN